MPRWWKEIGLVALAGAVCGTVIPRVMLPPTAQARGIPVRFRATPRAAPETPLPDPAAPEPAPTAAAAAPVDDSTDLPVDEAAPRRAAHRGGASRAAPGLRRVGGRWRIDVGGVESPRALLSGMQLAPPTEPGGVPDGYRVLATDRAGYARAAGVRVGDVLVAADGRALRSPDDALDALIAVRRARRVSLTFRRGASRYEVPVEVVGADDVGLR